MVIGAALRGNNCGRRSVKINQDILAQVRITFLIATFALVHAARPATTTEEFAWKYGGRLIGRLTVPKGFVVETYNYREGIVTTLRYPDGAHILLQVGGMYRIPLFQGADHDLISTTELDKKTIRVGRFASAELYWREDNYKPKKTSGKPISLLALFPPNVAYAKVSSVRRAEFDQALDSFVREIEKNTGRGR